MAPNEASIPLWRRARRRLWWLALLAVAALCEGLPPALGRAGGRAFGRLALGLRPRERRRAAANLARVFPDLPDAARAGLLREVAAAGGANLYDTLAIGRLLSRPDLVEDAPDADGRGLVEVIRREHAAGRGVLVLAGHLGCWELQGAWLGRALTAAGLGPLHVVTAAVRNPPVDRWLARRREALGLCALPRQQGVAPLLRCLRAGGVAAVLIDQNTGADSALVPFLGLPAPTPTGPARLAVARGTPVVVAALARRPDGGHRVWHGPVWRADPERPRQEQVLACLRAVNDQLTDRVRGNPAEWVWYHRRWPDGPAGGNGSGN